MLNQTNLENNNNKYYIIQLLKDNSGNNYNVWMRWGRVGKKGQSSLVTCRDLESAKKIFKQKFSDKTKNDWEDRDDFEKVKGKYDLLKLDHNADKDEPTAKKPKEEKKPNKEPIVSKLDQRLRELIELICDLEAMEQVVREMSYDANKAPLGKLTKDQITAGYLALKNIEDILEKKGKRSDLVHACNDYYTRIPHDFGMRRPPIISDVVDLKKELELLETLGDIEIAVRMLKDIDTELKEHPVDRHYKSLNCDLKPLDKKDKEFKMVEEYLLTSHASTHSQYKMELQEVFVCHKESEHKNFKDYGNRMLLFHGSRLSNWVGILSQGLRIAPPEAPHTGYMFGKGIYFADRSSKSANYCYPTRTKNTGLVLLCEVSLGEAEELTDARDMASKLPKIKHSVKGMGRVIPDPKNVKTENGVAIPLGTSVDATKADNFCLNYNEYIVYNTEQVKMSYLLKVNFKFN